MNQPPQITTPDTTLGRVPLPIPSDPVRVVVTASDPEGDTLAFLWSIPGAPEEPDVTPLFQDNGDQGSVLTLPKAWVNSGDVVIVAVTDQATPRNVVRVEWDVEVIE